MRKIEFNVPYDVMPDFAEELDNKNLTNSICGTTEDDEIIVRVDYEKSETDEVNELEEFLDELIENREDEDEDEENEGKD